MMNLAKHSLKFFSVTAIGCSCVLVVTMLAGCPPVEEPAPPREPVPREPAPPPVDPAPPPTQTDDPWQDPADPGTPPPRDPADPDPYGPGA